MLLKTAINEISGLRYMVEKLEIQSGLAKRVLLSTAFISQDKKIEEALHLVEKMVLALEIPKQAIAINKTKAKLMQVRDIQGSLKNLSAGSTLDEIELFEIKNMAFLAKDIRQILADASLDMVLFPDLAEVISLLDPERTKIPTFYIYDAYSPALAAFRKQLKQKKSELEQLRNQGIESIFSQEAAIEEIRLSAILLEDEIRRDISAKLIAQSEALRQSLECIASLDILIAKAKLVSALSLCKPEVSKDNTSFIGIFNPQLRELLNAKGQQYQPVDIKIERSPCIITGANMAGKTVLLKTIALAQYLFQFGFFVPAAKAEIVPVKAVLFSFDDEQSELSGLSSFAAEILKVNGMLKTAKSNPDILILIDELARTTNPDEGKAIVTALANMLCRLNIRSLITTHYSNLDVDFRRLRVKGFIEGKTDVKATIENITEFIDYSLTEDDGDVPREALRIAEILGVDAELIEAAKNEMQKATL